MWLCILGGAILDQLRVLDMIVISSGPVTNKQLLRTAPILHCSGSAPSMHVFIYLLCDVFLPYLFASKSTFFHGFCFLLGILVNLIFLPCRYVIEVCDGFTFN
jgi:hypothetical protein